jgi:chemotaxis receptor (MCP) glutamine deamidase CheD
MTTMQPSRPPREIAVAPDHFETTGRDGVLCAMLDSSLVVCICDSKREVGGLAHLRFLADVTLDVDATDTTLASDLLLLDGFLATMRKAAPPWSPLSASLHASAIDTPMGERATETVLDVVRQFLRDAGIEILTEDVRKGGEYALRFVVRGNQVNVAKKG